MQGKFEDLTGKKFNRLTVKGFSHSKDGNSYWVCLCDCNNETIVAAHKLKRNSTKSCGCLSKEKWEDLTGNVFGRLTVTGFSHKVLKKSFFCCTCSCGRTLIARGDQLKSGHTKSCGCFHSQKISGSNSPFWQGGVTDYNEQQRKTPEYRKLRYKTRKQDKCCKICGNSEKLRVHHLSSFATDEKNRLNPNNLVTLCLSCHLDFHKKYGRTGNSYYQFILYFLGKRKCLEITT